MESKPPTSPEYQRFTSLVDKVLSVSREELLKRQEEYKRQSEANPNRRGPKRKPASESA
jgi:hypothetical protein